MCIILTIIKQTHYFFRSLLAMFGSLIISGTFLEVISMLRPSEVSGNIYVFYCTVCVCLLRYILYLSTFAPETSPGIGYQLLASFSIYQNTKKLLDTSSSKRPELIPCLDGIRFLSMTWVVVYHTYTFTTDTVLLTAINANDIHKVSFIIHIFSCSKTHVLYSYLEKLLL